MRKHSVALMAIALTAAAVFASSGAEASKASVRRQPYVFDAPISTSNGMGEPEIAVDRRHPNDLVAAYIAGGSVSHDGGRHWRPFDGFESAAGDTVALSDGAGRLFYASLLTDPYTHLASQDGGRTWAKVGGPLKEPVAFNQSLSTSVEPEDGPLYMGPSAIGCDRPLSGVDLNTGTLIASCSDHGDSSGGEKGEAWETFFLACRANAFSTSGMSTDCGRRYVSISRDHGKTWTDWQPEDSADYPTSYTGGFGGIPVGAHGVLATAYVAAAAPGSYCTQCAIFETSTDAGKTWHRHLVPDVTPQIRTWSPSNPLSFLAGDPQNWTAQALVVDNQSVWFEPYVAADPSRKGRFAIMVLDANRTALLVYQTTDSGKTWHGPAVVGDRVHRVDKPAMAYGPSGALGVMWKSVHEPDLSFDVWAAVSRAGGLTFGRAVRLSSARSHKETCGSGGAEGQGYACDELSWMVMERGTLDAAWGDNRNGQNPWFGRYVFERDPQFKRH